MRAITYTQSGGPDVLRLVDRPVPDPGPGEVRVRLAFSGVNPTDWKSRSTADPGPDGKTPNQDGSGTVDAVGEGVDPVLVGERVWIWEAAYQRSYGTAAEYTVVPARQAVLLGADPSFELGAALAIPFLTAHRCLTLAESLPDRIGPGSLTGHTVLVQGGAGAVGNAAIQLARWADATVITTVSSPEKAQLAAAAGADHVVDYRQQDVVAEVRKIAPRRGGRDRRGEPGRERCCRRAGGRAAWGGGHLRQRRERSRRDRAGALADAGERALAVRARLHRAGAGQGARGRGRERRRPRRGDPGRPGGRAATARLPARGDGRRPTAPSRRAPSARC